MSTENTNTPTATENTSSSSTPTPDIISSMTTETQSTSSDNLQAPDFAAWLNDKLDSFEKGQETAPWEKTEEVSDDASKEETEETEEISEDNTEEESKSSEEETAEDDAEVKSMTGSAGAKFKQLKSELKTYKSKVAEMEKALAEREQRLNEVGEGQGSSAELDDLRSKVQAYEQEIAIARIEASPQFKEAVLEPTQAILDSVVSMAEKYEVLPKKLVEALREESMGDASDALMELAADFSERDRIRLYRMADDLADVSRRRDYLKQNASKAMAELIERQKAEEAEQDRMFREQAVKAAEVTWSETFENNPVIKSLGDDVIKELQSASSEADFADTTPEERAYALYSGVALPHLVKKYAELSSKLAETEKALSKYKKATPKVSGNTDTTPAKQEVGGFLDAIEKRFSLG